MELPDGTTAPMAATPVDFDGRSRMNTRPAPGLGEHTEAVLGELGMEPDRLRELRARNVIA